LLTILSFGSRVTGYPGATRTSEFLATKFEEYGLQPYADGGTSYLQRYPITIPFDFGANITIGNRVFSAYSLWPNSVQACTTPEGGITGPLIYAGDGDLEDFNGKPVKDSIVLLDFNSGTAWMDAAKLGAKAVIFTEPTTTTRIESEKKFANTPLYFPRLYVTKETASELVRHADGNTSATVRVGIRYIATQATNVLGYIKGSMYPSEIVVVSCHYDAWSSIPALVPGADEAVSIQILLQLAKFFSMPENRPKRTVLFVAFSGHWQALAGARYFVEEHFMPLNGKTIVEFLDTEKPAWMLLHVNLDISTDNHIIGIGTGGSMYHYYQYNPNYLDIAIKSLIISSPDSIWAGMKHAGWLLSDDLSQLLYTQVQQPDSETQIPIFHMFDIEPFATAGGHAIAYFTSPTYRLQQMHQFDTIDVVDMQNAFIQSKFVFASIYTFANKESLGLPYIDGGGRPQRFLRAGLTGLFGDGSAGYLTINGQMAVYDTKTGLYLSEELRDPSLQLILDTVFSHSWVDSGSSEAGNAITNPFAHIIQLLSSPNFTVVGVPPFVAHRHNSEGFATSFYGYAIDKKTKQIVYAPDVGGFGDGQWNFINHRFLSESETTVKTILLRCGSMVIFDIVNPITMSAPTMDYNRYLPTPNTAGILGPSSLGSIYASPLKVVVNDFLSHTQPLSYGLIVPALTGEPIVLVFVQPGSIIEILFRWGPANTVVGVFTNFSYAFPDGAGYAVKFGDYNVLDFTAYRIAHDLFWLNDGRLRTLAQQDVRDGLADFSQSEARKNLQMAERSVETGFWNYSLAYRYALNAWSWSVQSYAKTIGLIENVTSTSLFFAVLLLPFAFIMEKLLFSFEDLRRRLLSGLGIFSLSMLLIYLLHPGLRVASNVLAVNLGFFVFVLTAIIFGMLMSRSFDFLREFRTRMIGEHFADISRTAAAMTAFSVGLSNMRKRVFRTGLTLSSILIITVGLITLTSASTFAIVKPSAHPLEIPYEGILVLVTGGISPLPSGIKNILVTELGPSVPIAETSILLPAYPPATDPLTTQRYIVTGPNGTAIVGAFMGMSPEMQAVFKEVPGALLRGYWFEAQDRNVAIISQTMSKSLGMKEGQHMRVAGLDLFIKGIFDDRILDSLRDINGLPLNPSIFGTAAPTAGTISQTVPFSRVILSPFDFSVNELGATVHSMSVLETNFTKSQQIANIISLQTNSAVDVYVAHANTLYTYARTDVMVISGWQMLLIPLAIGALVVANTMLGSIYERKREIQTLSSVGLSPIHIGAMFLAESTMYAVVSATGGYLIGLAILHLLIQTNLLPTYIVPNFTSTWVLLVLILTFAVTLLPSAYPMFIASRLVTPSLTRKWEMPTKPVGDYWDMPLPVEFISKDEAAGFLAYVKEFLDASGTERAGLFYTRTGTDYRMDTGVGVKRLYIATSVALQPYDSGLIQDVSLMISQIEKGGKWKLSLVMHRLGGPMHTWVTSSIPFIDMVRKQILIWRGLAPDRRMRYISDGSKAFSSVESEGHS